MATASLVGCAALVAAAGLFGMVTRPAVPAATTDRPAGTEPRRGPPCPHPADPPPGTLGRCSGESFTPKSIRLQGAARRAAAGAATPSSLRDATAPVVDRAATPSIVLAGIAERQTTDGIARTAVMIVGDGELTMASIGQTIGEHLTVEQIGADRVVVLDRLRMTRLTVLLGQPDL